MGIGGAIRGAWVFNHMTPAQHLWEARTASRSPENIVLALEHVAAIPKNSPEASEAQVLGTVLHEQEAAARAAQAQKDEAANAARNARAAARNVRAAAITQLSADLNNLGYDLNVEAGGADAPTEIVITSSEFSDSDHRVRFLASIRGRSGLTASACWDGFDKMRLRSSRIPLVGFSESYSLDCYNR
jgi:hypothetical protein